MKITVDLRVEVEIGEPFWRVRVREGRGEPIDRAPAGDGLGFFSEAGAEVSVDLRFAGAGARSAAGAGAGAGLPAFRALRLGAVSDIFPIQNRYGFEDGGRSETGLCGWMNQ